MFYIYGGGFLNGHALYQNYGPHLFMDQGVVVVTVNYRTGPFGKQSSLRIPWKIFSSGTHCV